MEQSAVHRLVRRAQAGDASAFGELIAAHERAAVAIAYAVVGDVAQDAFLRAWQKLGGLVDPDRFGAWLGRIVRHGAADAVRRRPRPAAGPLDAAATVPSPASAPADDPELRADVGRALASLDEVTRSVVVLRYFDGLPSRAIGELLGLSVAAVDMRLSRARAELRVQLAPHAAVGGGDHAR